MDGHPWDTVEVDQKKMGLPCRGGCDKVFYPEVAHTDKEMLCQLLATARLRDFHERSLHRYKHVTVEHRFSWGHVK